jgi:hypothetical protein
MLEAKTVPIIREADSGKTGESKPSSAASKAPAAVDQPRIHQGLCVNCDVRETCTFSRPEGGVWYCEEYQ